MKRFLLLILLLDFLVVGLLAQSVNNQDEVCKIDQNAARAYRQGELIVKFNPKKRIRVATSSAVEGSNSVNSIFEKMGVENIEQLMPLSNEVQTRSLRSVSGGTVNANDMSQLYRVAFSNDTLNVHEVAEELGELEEVEFAEPNYLVYTLSTGESTEADSYEAEPLMKDQWALNAVNIKHVWTQKKVTDKRPVIAILDTGVDITHPDLEGNIWTNEAEANGVEDEDDDNNGYKDDIHGYDFVNQTARIGDWNGHGTHCAGIAAADGKNGKGIAGANPDALIMPVTVMQSDGTGDVATIIKGIDYAAANGADVISMSIGGYGYSMAEEQALAHAYSTAVLVAAAGNDFQCINPHFCPVNGSYGNRPMYPAAFTFVLGVEAADKSGNLASFSNFDDDGPTFSNPTYFTEEQLYNYELRAPGLAITSTYPGGRYKALNGTSMACPLVAGGISRLLQCKPYSNKELLFADLIHARKKSSSNIVDFKATYNITDADRIPELQWVTYALKDSVGGDNDLRPDAGETIEIYPVLRTMWGKAENITLQLAMPDTEDPTIVEFIDNNVSFGKTLNSYAKARSANPLRFKINDNCADGRHIRLVLRATCDATDQVLEQELGLKAENGVEIGGMIDKDLTLYPNVHYIVTKPLAVPDGVTLTIKPGTVLKFKENTGLSSAYKDRIICNGTPDSMIVFTMADGETGKVAPFVFSQDTLSYVRFENFYSDRFLEPGSVIFSNCVFKGNDSQYFLYLLYNASYIFENCVFLDNYMIQQFVGNRSIQKVILRNCNYIENKEGIRLTMLDSGDDQKALYEAYSSNIFSNLANSTYYNVSTYTKTPTIVTNQYPNYWGTSYEHIARKGIYDMEHPLYPQGFCKIDLSNMLMRPSAEAHGIVWKVVVNGYDAQDEFDQLPPLGVGKHKFEVYFNRPMNKEVVPFVAMGVRPPYTQKSIAEDGAWNEDGTIYTAYLTIDGKTGIDGLNRIYVADAEDDEHLEIPVERVRFNVEVAAAGSMATGLMAEPGLGKVSLTWETDEEDFADLLGYNIYRHTAAGVKGDTVIVNSTVIDSEETNFVDYSVVPGTTYYYAIKQLTTSLTSHALSNEVAATPLTATKGDANGSMSVDVADVVTEIAYLTNQNPQPFIFEAADVNADNTVNILDVVGTVNIIITPQAASMSVNSSATYSIEDGILYVETPVALGGVQVQLSGKSGDEFTAMPALDAFERVGVWNTETDYLFMAYSMSGKTLLPGKYALLRINHADVDAVVLSDVLGKNVVAIDGNVTGIGAIEAIQIRTPYPSPFNTELHIPYVIGKDGIHRVDIVITDLMGRTVHEYSVQNDFGQYEYVWSPNNILSNGIYVVSLYADDVLMQSTKVIYNR